MKLIGEYSNESWPFNAIAAECGDELAVSNEGFKEIGQKILAYFRAFINKLKSIWSEFRNVIRAEANTKLAFIAQAKLRTQASTSLGQKNPFFEVTTHLNSLSSRYVPFTDVGKIIYGMGDLKRIYEANFDWATGHHIGAIEKVASILKNTDVDAEAQDAKLTAILKKDSPFVLADKLKMHRTEEEHDTVTSVAVLGNKRLCVRGKRDSNEVQDFASVRLFIGPSSNSQKPLPTKIAFNSFGYRDNSDLLAICETLCHLVLKTHSRENLSRMKKVLDDLESVSSTLTRLVEQDSLQLNEPRLRLYIRLTKAMLSWLNEPYDSLAQTVLAAVGAGLMLSRSNRS